MLYGARAGSETTSDLYTVDTATAALTSVGPMGFAVTALAFAPVTGTLYGVTSNNSAASPSSLISIDRDTGDSTLIGALGLGAGVSCADIAITTGGTMYGWSSGSTKQLVTIDKATGAASVIGTGSHNAGGIAFVGSTLYHVWSAGVTTINLATGAETTVAGGGDPNGAIAWSGDDMFIARSNGVLSTIDLATGALTTVGTPAFLLDALAWTPVAGEPPRGVCIAPDDDWSEVSPTWVRLDDPLEDWRLRVSQVTIDRGKSNELDTTKTGTAAITFKDPDGLLDPTNTTSPFYDTDNSVTKLNPNVQVAVARRNPVTGEWSTRFRGFTKQWTYDMDTSGFSTVTLEAVDLFELLADLEMTPGDQGDTAPAGMEGDIYFRGGSTIGANSDPIHVDDRIIEALDDAGVPTEWQDIFSGNVQVQEMRVERYGQLLEVLFAAADAEFPGVANIYVSSSGVIRFRGRFARFFPERPGYGIGEWDIGGAAQAAADATIVRLQSFTFRRSKEDIYNKALALPQGLVDGDVPGQMVSDPTSIAKYGIRPWVGEELLTWRGHNDDASPTNAVEETLKFATYRVDNYKEPKNRIEQIVVRLLRPDHFSGPAVWDFLCGVEIGDVLNVDTTHRGGGGFNERYFVEGLREVEEKLDGTMNDVTVIVDVSPESFFDSNPFGEVDDGNPES